MKKLILLVLAMIFIIPSSTRVNASPVITNVDQLADNHTLKNPLKIWSVLKASGFSDSAAAGVLGNMQKESSFDPSTVEGIYSEYLNPEGPLKKAALKNLNDYAINTLFPLYKKSGWGIKASTNNQGQSVPESSGSPKIDTGAYLGKDGKYTVGIGLIQYTGYRASLLTIWTEKNKYKWYEIEPQLYYFLYQGEDGDTRTKWLLDEYRKLNGSPEEMGHLFSIQYEGQTVDAPNRRATARYWFDKFRGQKGDVSYAQKVLSKIGLQSSYTLDDNYQDTSIIKEIYSPSLIMGQNSGNIFKKTNHEQIAVEVQNEVTGEKKSEKQYSLYQRFGSDIQFFRYMGESTQPIQLLDHVYSVYTQDALDSLNFSTLWYNSKSYLSNNVYKGRPKVLTSQNLKEGLFDPRVVTSELTFFSGYPYNYAQFNLGVAKFITNLVTTLVGKEPFNMIRDVTNVILDKNIAERFLQPILMIILVFAIMFFILSFVKLVIQYFKGESKLRRIMIRFITGVISISLIMLLSSNPARFSNLVYKATTSVDSLFNYALNLQMKDDVVVTNSDSEQVQEAVLWKKTLFESWVRGVFKEDYENLYTQYSDKDSKHKMNQSYATEEEIQNLETDKFTYNSVELTGDIGVPLGNNTYERNWAAYLYSVQSPYHIDHLVVSKESTSPSKTFPNATTTANNKNIRADMFRIIDALMNISPQIYKGGLTVDNYTGSRMIGEDYIAQSNIMLLNSIVLALFFLPLIIIKFKHIILLFFSLLKMIFYSFKEVVKEGDGFGEIFTDIGKNFTQFFITCFKLYMMTVFYNLLIGKGFLQFVIFIVLGLMIYGVTLKQVKQKVRDTYDWSKHTYRGIVNKF